MTNSKENSYQVLARKYRPNLLSELIGQEVLVTTLKNSFELKKIAHAFILTGVRGVGKTTTARIIARSLNCIGENGTQQETITPCGICINCTSIKKDNNMDVIEIDAASKTGVDDMREIIDTIKYKPVSARYKIYIIDEVHMLSKNAFNALLKTLEEPPEHVKFIFATTEIKKVPITILSRCQRFDLKRVQEQELSNHLKNICQKEEVEAEEKALNLLAKAATGSVRDSLSLLDQAIVFTDKNITENKITEMLGYKNKNLGYKLLENIITLKKQETFNLYQEAFNNGLDLEDIAQNMLESLHNLIMFQEIKEVLSKDLTEEELNFCNSLSNKIITPHLFILWQILLQGIKEIKEANNQKITAEILFLKLLWHTELQSINQIIEISPTKNPTSSPKIFTTANKESTQTQKKETAPFDINNLINSIQPTIKTEENTSALLKTAQDTLKNIATLTEIKKD